MGRAVGAGGACAGGAWLILVVVEGLLPTFGPPPPPAPGRGRTPGRAGNGGGGPVLLFDMCGIEVKDTSTTS